MILAVLSQRTELVIHWEQQVQAFSIDSILSHDASKGKVSRSLEVDVQDVLRQGIVIRQFAIHLLMLAHCSYHLRP